MAYFPFFIDIKGQKCLIAGGGMVACRKVMVLKEYDPEITVVAPEIVSQLADSAKEEVHSIRLLKRQFTESDLDGMDFVVAATDDKALNRRISEICHKKRLPVNVIDDQDLCSFIFPALIKEKDITIGISTGGSSPNIAKELKNRFQDVIPDGFGDLAVQLAGYRDLVKAGIDDQSVRSEIFKDMVETGIRQGGVFTEEQARELIEKKLHCQEVRKD